MTYVLDASAILALLKKEKGYLKVKKILAAKPKPFVHAINRLEVEYKLKKFYTGQKLTEMMSWMKRAPMMTVELLTPEITDYARKLKTDYSLSLGDSIGLALAKWVGYAFLTADRQELIPIAKSEKVKIKFLR